MIAPLSLKEARERYAFAVRRFEEIFGRNNVLFCLYGCRYCVGLGATNAEIETNSVAGLRSCAVLIAKYQDGLYNSQEMSYHYEIHAPVEQFDLAKFGADRMEIVDQIAGEVFEALERG